MTSALVNLAPHLHAGWTADPIGYYIHKGYVYVSGEIYAAAPSATQTLFSGLPAGIRPAAPVSVTLRTDPAATDDPANPALNLPSTWASTVNPDGTWTLDAPVPTQVNVTPPVTDWWYCSGSILPGPTVDPTHYPQYTSPLNLGIIIGGVRWPLPGTAPADTFTTSPLAPHLGMDFDDVDSGYSNHGSRVHLSGHIRARVDGPSYYLGSLPPGSAAGVGHDGTAQQFGGRPGSVGPTNAAIDTDQIVPAGDSPPLAVASPTFSPALRNLNSPPALIGGDAGFDYNGYDSMQDYQEWIGATYSCTYPDPHPGDPFATITVTGCKTPVIIDPVSTFNLADLVAQCSPQPDWFIVFFEINWTYEQPNDGRCHNPPLGPDPTGCGPSIPLDATVTLTGAELRNSDESPAIPRDRSGTLNPVFDEAGVWTGYLAPPASLYVGHPRCGLFGDWLTPTGFSPGLLWRPSQATTITVSQSCSIHSGGTLRQARIIPFWERRQDGLHSGDTLDLTGWGWEGTMTGEVDIGPALAGMVRK